MAEFVSRETYFLIVYMVSGAGLNFKVSGVIQNLTWVLQSRVSISLKSKRKKIVAQNAEADFLVTKVWRFSKNW